MAIGITQRFVGFFVLTAILPALVLGGLLVHSVNQRLESRLDNLLDTGRELVQSVLAHDLDQLELLDSQAAYLSVNEKYQHYLETNQSRPLENLLNRLQAEKNLDIVALLDRHGRIEASSNLMEDTFALSFRTIINNALRGKATSTIEQFGIRSRYHPNLFYVAAVPVYSQTQSNQQLGVLVIGQRIRDNFSMSELKRLNAQIGLRIYQHIEQHHHLVISSFTSVTPEELVSIPKKAFDETIQNQPYRSVAVPINNFKGDTVGIMMVSVPKRDEALLTRSSLLDVTIYTLLMLVIVIAVGFWFNRSFVTPVFHIAQAATTVAEEGILSVQVPEANALPEMRRVIRAFNRMLRQLLATEALRNTFIAALTHDLRTPLLAEKRTLETMDEFRTELPERYARLSSDLLKSNQQLLEMVNRLLETYQYEAGKVDVVPVNITLTPLVQDVFNKLTPLADARHIALTANIPENFPTFRADYHQLERVLTNLVGNAIDNIQEHKTITIGAQADAQWITIRVADNGPGIPADRLPYLFERYSTGHQKAKKIGSGLGLYICRLILENHGGGISVESPIENDEGTAFVLKLPS